MYCIVILYEAKTLSGMKNLLLIHIERSFRVLKASSSHLCCQFTTLSVKGANGSTQLAVVLARIDSYVRRTVLTITCFFRSKKNLVFLHRVYQLHHFYRTHMYSCDKIKTYWGTVLTYASTYCITRRLKLIF